MTAGDPAQSPTTQSPTTGELLGRAVHGEHGAWDQVVRRCEPAVTATVRSYRLQDADAHDAAQRTWLLLLEHGHRIREPEALVGWLRTTARRECLRILREEGRAAPLPDAVVGCLADPRADLEAHAVEADIARRLRALVRSLPARSRLLVRLLFFDDLGSYAELSRRTGIPVGSIGPTRARALRRLRPLLERERDDQDGPAPWRERCSTALACTRLRTPIFE